LSGVSPDLRKTLREHRFAAIASSLLAAWLLRGLCATWRVRIEGNDPLARARTAHLGAFWHRNALIAAVLFRDRGFGVAVSRSRDGDLISALLLRLGYTAPARGSSSRGGVSALRKLVRMLESGTTVSIQTDGPRGPARRSKPGILTLSRLGRAAIIPVSFSAAPCLRFGSWDRTLLPLPFARVTCAFGDPIDVPPGLAPDQEAPLLERLDAELNRTTDALDDRYGLRDPNRPIASGSQP
jgi:lysophospholipid acyltransferase (LPLAT)-like uncharacterized protein